MGAGAGGLDLNDSGPPPKSKDQYDLDALAKALGERAEAWVPSFFPNARRDGSELRLGDIDGRPPKKQGSCVIQLTGDSAAWWYDFSTGQGGGPLSLLKEATGLEGKELFKKAAELSGSAEFPNREERKQAARSRSHSQTKRSDAAAQEIAHLLAQAVAPAGTLVETYLRSRSLELPPEADILFRDNATDWSGGVGRPVMLGVVKMADGTPTGGLHRTYLAYDGSGKAEDAAKQKMMLGPVKGGSVHLAPLGGDGVLGISEGIETGIAAMMTWNIPVWAALSTSGMRDLALPEGLLQLVIFADAGEAGERAAVALQERALAGGAQCRIERPRGGDDFNSDLMQAPKAEDLVARISALHKDTPAEQIGLVLKDLALSRPDPVAKAQTLNRIKAKTGIGLKSLQTTMRALVKEVPPQIVPRGGTPDWTAALIANLEGEPRSILFNAVKALETAPELQNLIWMDEFSARPVLRRRPPWLAADLAWNERPWGDDDSLALTVYLQHAGVMVPSAIVKEGVIAAAYTNPYHPVRDYLAALAWDGTPRLDTWAIRHMGCTDNAYVRAISSRWTVAAVARVMRPGIKADYMMVIEGEQDIGKSSVLRALFDPWFSDEMPDPGNKDGPISMLGKWCIEFAEMEILGRVAAGRLKAFMRRATDRYRPVWGSFAVDQPRQCVFAGTINEYEWGNDATGLTRFWPVRAAYAKPLECWNERDQLWAEAYARWEAGEKIYLHEPELIGAARLEQHDRQPEDAWDARIADFLHTATANSFATSDVLAGIAIPVDRWDARAQRRVGSWFIKNHWIRSRQRRSGKQIWVFTRPDSPVLFEND